MTKRTLAATALLFVGLISNPRLRAQDAPAAAPAPKAAAPKPARTQGAPGTVAVTPGAATAAKKPATTAGTASPLKTTKEKASYAIGQKIGTDVANGLKRDGVEIDAASLARGIRDAVSGAKPLLTPEEAQVALKALETEVRAKLQAKMEAVGAANKQQGPAFLAANKSKPGVVVLPSGLQYKILKAGTGPKPAAGDKVTCNYAGTLIDGKEFDSSYKRGEPVTFPLGDVIKGWSEALQLMPVGSKWQLFIPSELAYADHAQGPDIGPNATLIFELELISIAPKADASK